MLNFCGFVAAILKMAIGRNFSMSGINSGHDYLPTYQILMISDNVEFLPPIFYAVFLAAILKMADIWKILKMQNYSSNGDLSLCQILWDWVYCLPSVNTICGRIMIGLSLLSSVSKHNMRSCYDWVVVVVVRQ